MTRRSSRRKKKRESQKVKPAGGIGFFISFICIALIAGNNLVVLPALFDGTAVSHWLRFAAGAATGTLLAWTYFTGRFSVFIHELKHSIISGLVGNRAKRMRVRKRSGYFQYEYTKDTEHFNAFIALAPYWLPLFTILSLIIGIVFFPGRSEWLALIVGIGFGADLLMNMRDISPIQTDLTHMRGGYRMSIAFIVATNLALTTTLLAWVGLGTAGLQQLFEGFYSIVLYIVALIRKGTP